MIDIFMTYIDLYLIVIASSKTTCEKNLGLSILLVGKIRVAINSQKKKTYMT